MFRICLRLATLAALSLAAPVAADTLSGIVRVVDGDTIELSGPQNIRLIGIDAPEGAQPCTAADGTAARCGAVSTAMAKAAFDGRKGQCEVEAYDRYDRPLAVCYVDGRDINADLVTMGAARIYRGGMQHEDARYAEEQKEAVLLNRGIWAYVMDDPAVWRAAQRNGQSSAPTPTGPCRIKGNISASGHIYHMPGQRDYEATRISARRGERLFCTEAEARAAGWRRAKR